MYNSVIWERRKDIRGKEGKDCSITRWKFNGCGVVSCDNKSSCSFLFSSCCKHVYMYVCIDIYIYMLTPPWRLIFLEILPIKVKHHSGKFATVALLGYVQIIRRKKKWNAQTMREKMKGEDKKNETVRIERKKGR